MDDHKLGVIFDTKYMFKLGQGKVVCLRNYHNCRYIFQKGAFSFVEVVSGEGTRAGRIGI